MPTLGYDPQRIRELAGRAQRVVDHLAAFQCADPLAADAVSIARSVASHVTEGWLPTLLAVERSRALLDPIGLDGGEVPATAEGHVIGDVVATMTEQERAYFQGFVDASAVSVAQDLWLYDAEPNYDTSRLPPHLETLDSADDWDWLAKLYLVERYHHLAATGKVQVQRNADGYWIDPLDLQDNAEIITADVILAAVSLGSGFKPGGGFSEASAKTHVSPMPEPRPPEANPSPNQRTTKTSWGDLAALDDHASRHGADFGVSNADVYARLAAEFREQPGTLKKVDETGVVRIYDAETNTFGSYNADGTTRTFDKPDPLRHGEPTNADYWNKQRGRPM